MQPRGRSPRMALALSVLGCCLLAGRAVATCPGLPGPGGTVYLMLAACGDALPNAGCSGPAGGSYQYAGNLTANVWVQAYQDGACTVGPAYSQFNQLPAGAMVFARDAAELYYQYLPASSFTLGGGAAFTPPFDVSQLDLPTVELAFAAGFVLVGMCWALGQAVGAILRVVRK